MKPTEGAKLLKATLKRMDLTKKIIPERACFYPATWVLIAFFIFGNFVGGEAEWRGVCLC